MSEGDFFVMLEGPSGEPIPMVIFGSTAIATFATEHEAAEAARAIHFGKAYGFEIFERGYGQSYGPGRSNA